MPGPQSQVADLILQLMMRGKSGGLPMQASPELTQYLAHAQAGSAPPQLRGLPSADVLQGPGSGAAAVRQPFDFEGRPFQSKFKSHDDIMAALGSRYDESGRQPDMSPMDMLTDRPPPNAFRHAGGDGTEDQLFIWYTNEKGQRVRLDGPFANDIEAARALREMRQSGLDPNAQVEIAPDFDPRP